MFYFDQGSISDVLNVKYVMYEYYCKAGSLVAIRNMAFWMFCPDQRVAVIRSLRLVCVTLKRWCWCCFMALL